MRARRRLALAALAIVLVLPVTPMCAFPRAPASGPMIAELGTGPFCAARARDVRVRADGVDFHGGGGCRYCPEEVSVRVRSEPPGLAAEWGFVGATLVARRVERTGCGGSGCEYLLTAWWPQRGGWVVVRGRAGETDDLFGGGPPFEVTWGAVAATCAP